MISIYTGRPGSGKSYHAAKVAYSYLATGGNVICNTDLDYDAVVPSKGFERGNYVLLENRAFTVDYLVRYAFESHSRAEKGYFFEDQTLILIDESQNLFNSRSWRDDGRLSWNDFFQQHRKLGYTVLFVAQSLEYLDKQIRELIQAEYNHRLVSCFGRLGRFLSFVKGTGGKLFLCVEYDISSLKPLRNGWKFVKPVQEIYDFYDSYKLFENKYVNYFLAEKQGIPGGLPL